MTTHPLGRLRYWWACPECGRRYGCLYLPPGRRRFACRLCYNLAYRSNQEENKSDSMWRWMGQEMGGYSPADMRFIMGEGRRFTPGGRLAQELAQRIAANQAEQARMLAAWLEELENPHPDYLTAVELCERSGLTSGDLAAFEAARLLLPDTSDRRYRPKLAGWGRKLAYLLGEGWTLAELAAWARGRWSTDNPRQFPPERAAWAGVPDHAHLEGG